MIVKFSSHGKGKASGVLNYLLRERGRNGSDSSMPRQHAKVLYGDPVLTEYLIDTTRHKSKYKSGYLSFSEHANEISEENKRKIMQEFENTIFAGLEPDQYDILWIEHADKDIDENHSVGRLELNFVIPCQELRTGKAFQPYYEPADQKRVNAWKNLVNLKVKTIAGDSLSDPNDPERARLINPYNSFAPRPSPFNLQNYKSKPKESDKDKDLIASLRNKNELEDAIKRLLQLRYEQGHIINRLSVMKQLTEWGLTITRSKNESSVSITSDNLTDKNGRKLPIRLKGGMFQSNFSGAQYRTQSDDKDLASYKYNDPFSVKNRLVYNERTWQEGIKIKTTYHQERYANAIAPAPLLLNTPTVTSKDNELKKGEPKTPSYNPRPRF